MRVCLEGEALASTLLLPHTAGSIYHRGEGTSPSPYTSATLHPARRRGRGRRDVWRARHPPRPSSGRTRPDRLSVEAWALSHCRRGTRVPRREGKGNEGRKGCRAERVGRAPASYGGLSARPPPLFLGRRRELPRRPSEPLPPSPQPPARSQPLLWWGKGFRARGILPSRLAAAHGAHLARGGWAGARCVAP